MGTKKDKTPIKKGAGDLGAALWCDREPLAAYLWAKRAWLTGSSMQEIQLKTGFPRWRIDSWIYGFNGNKDAPEEDKEGWKVQREKMEVEVLKRTFKAEKERFLKIMGKGLEVLETGFDHMLRQASELSPKDMSSVSTVVKTIHDIYQLQSGKPTAIVARGKITPADVRKKLFENDIVEYAEKDEKEPIVN